MADLEKMVKMMNEQHSGLDTKTLLRDVEIKSKPKYFSKRGIWVLALAGLLVLPVVASGVSPIINDFVRHIYPSVATSIEHGKGQPLNLEYKIGNQLITFDYAVFDENEAYILGTLDIVGEMAAITKIEEEIEYDNVGMISCDNRKIDGSSIEYWYGSFERVDWLPIEEWYEEENQNKKFILNFIYQSPVEYPSTLSFDFSSNQYGKESIDRKHVSIELDEAYRMKPKTVELDETIEIKGNLFTLEKLEFTNVSTRLYVKADPNNKAYLGDLQFSVNGEDTKSVKYNYGRGLLRIGKDDDEQLVFLGESRMFDYEGLNELHLYHAGLIDKESYHTTFNTKTFEMANGKDKEFKKTLWKSNFLLLEKNNKNRYVGPCVIREDAENISNNLFIRYHDCGIPLKEDDAEEIPIIYRDMHGVPMYKRIPIDVE